MTVKDPNGSQFVTTLAVDEEAGEQSMLIVENRGSGSAIRELHRAGAGRSRGDAVPKKLAQGPVTRERILVALHVK